MDVRRRAVHRVLVEGCSLSEAAREFGLSRPTLRRWRDRALEGGIAGLSELSRRPDSCPRQSSAQIREAVLSMKDKHPDWGASKIAWKLWGEEPLVCVRTVDRMLKAAGLVRLRGARGAAVQRFERASCNELWQMDFKGLGSPRLGWSPLSVIDDRSRFCLAFEPVAAHSTEAVWPVLWNLFGEFGLPEQILSDNEACFHTSFGAGPSAVEARLWLLGIQTRHCRPGHPQTQGKVERFHRTAQGALGGRLRQPTLEMARPVCSSFVDIYNWERPHEALDMRVPGEIYAPSSRLRPPAMPAHAPLGEGRKVDASGKFRWRSQNHRAGHGLMGEYVDVRGAEVFYAGILLGTLEQMRV